MSIKTYSTSEMCKIWSKQEKYKQWVNVLKKVNHELVLNEIFEPNVFSSIMEETNLNDLIDKSAASSISTEEYNFIVNLNTLCERCQLTPSSYNFEVSLDNLVHTINGSRTLQSLRILEEELEKLTGSLEGQNSNQVKLDNCIFQLQSLTVYGQLSGFSRNSVITKEIEGRILRTFDLYRDPDADGKIFNFCYLDLFCRLLLLINALKEVSAYDCSMLIRLQNNILTSIKKNDFLLSLENREVKLSYMFNILHSIIKQFGYNQGE